MSWLLPVAVKILRIGDLHAFGWGGDPGPLTTPVKATRVRAVKTLVFYWAIHYLPMLA